MKKDQNKTNDTNQGMEEDITHSVGQGMSTLCKFICKEQNCICSEQKLQ